MNRLVCGLSVLGTLYGPFMALCIDSWGKGRLEITRNPQLFSARHSRQHLYVELAFLPGTSVRTTAASACTRTQSIQHMTLKTR